jgi:hypothetical protein
VFTPARTAALTTLADHAAVLNQRLDAGDVPTARELRQIAPDLHAMLELLDDVHRVVTGLPGAERARVRGDEPHPQV